MDDYTLARVLALGWMGLIAVALACSMTWGGIADYGLPWRPTRNVNGRRWTDLAATLMMWLLGIGSTVGCVVYALGHDTVTPTAGNAWFSAAIVAGDAAATVLWWRGRKEQG